MKISYNAEADSLRIIFLDAPATHRHSTQGITAEFDDAGRLIVLEIYEAQKSFGGASPLGEIVLEGVFPGLPPAPAANPVLTVANSGD